MVVEEATLRDKLEIAVSAFPCTIALGVAKVMVYV